MIAEGVQPTPEERGARLEQETPCFGGMGSGRQSPGWTLVRNPGPGETCSPS